MSTVWRYCCDLGKGEAQAVVEADVDDAFERTELREGKMF
jgi:hypothetical protein